MSRPSRSITRRHFLETSAKAGVAVGLASTLPGLAFADDHGGPKTILVLGGTGQTGPHLVRQLIDAGHTVTLSNRGNRSDDLFPDLECLIADRMSDEPDALKAITDELESGRRWDVCIDIWPHIPKVVETTAELLKDNVDHFLYVSSMSVYADSSVIGLDEDAEVLTAPDADETEYTMALFGNFKAECENRVRRIYPDNHTIFRPGLIVGPRDFSFRGGYWPVRVREGGEILAPGDGEDPIQQIDGRDLTLFEIRCMENGTTGTFNVVGPHPDTPLTMRRYLQRCKEATRSDATFVWADAEFLTENEIGPWMNMPNWLPREGEYAGFARRSVDRALAAGLTFRPLVDTIRDTLAWYDELTEERQQGVSRRAGIPREREAEVLAAWHAKNG